MTILRSWIPRILLGGFYAYMMAIAANYEGVLGVHRRMSGLAFLGVCAAVWLLIRWRRGWKWHADPLDLSMLLWIAAFALSLFANLEDWRRIAIGLWFMAAYMLGYYIFNDMLANRGLARWALLDALLIGSLVVVMTGWLQIFVSLQAGGGIPRTVGTLGNPNTLAAMLVALLPIIFIRAMQSRVKLNRFGLLAYFALVLALLITTYSRGAWIGAVAGLAFCGLWLLQNRGWTVARAKSAYQQLSGGRKALLTIAGLAGVAALVAGAVFIVYSLSFAGRTADLRTFIYETALQMFAEKPAFGHGVFTFGGGLARLNPTPPTSPHSHAHSVPLNIAAELGVVGLAALAVTVYLIYRAARRNLQTDTKSASGSAAAACGAVIAFGVHHLFDLPAMNPAVMLTGILVLSALVAPISPAAVVVKRGWLRGAVLIGVGLVLFISGMIGAFRYRDYWLALTGAADKNWIGVADSLETIITSDPSFAPYYQQQGLALSIAAMEGDETVLPRAIHAFEQFTRLAPQYASGWANLAALYAEAGQIDAAAAALRQLALLDAPVLFSWRETGVAYGEYNPDDPIAAEDPIHAAQSNINYIQWLHLAFPRTFAPQTTVPLPDAVWAEFDNNS